MREGFLQAIPFDPDQHGAIALPGGYTAIVDKADLPLISALRWQRFSSPGKIYVRCKANPSNGKPVFLHRLLIGASDGQLVDHISGDTMDNRRCNLRLCDASENCRNRTKHPNSQQPYKGIRFKDDCPKAWKARIVVDGREIHLGSFLTPIEAARAYDRAAIIHHGEFAATNVSLGLLPPSRDRGA